MDSKQQLDSVAKPSLQKLDFNAPAIGVVADIQHGGFPFYANQCCSNSSNNTDEFFFGFRYEKGAFDQADRFLTLYGIPLIILIGCLGNILSFIVFVGSHLRLQSSSVYLALLNAVDTLFLFCLFISWFDNIDVHVMGHQGVCQLVVYCSYVAAFMSVYTVTGFTVERWILVFLPQRKITWCTRRRAVVILCACSVVALLIYTLHFWTMGPVIAPYTDKSYCLPKPQFYTFLQVFSTIDTLITLIIPSLVIIILNVSISRKVMQFAKRESKAMRTNNNCTHLLDKRRELQEMGSICYVRKPSQLGATSQASTFSFKNLTLSKSGKPRSFRKRVQLRTTRSLLIVSTVFVLLNLPSHAFRTYAVIMEFGNANYVFSKTSLLCQKVLQLVYYANFSANFFLYSACSRSFRLALRRLCARVKHSVKARWNRAVVYRK